jgi:hypothetical protein
VSGNGDYRRVRSVLRACFCNADGTLHPAGKQAMAYLRDTYKVDESPFSADPLMMAKKCGNHEVVRNIMRWIELSDEKMFELETRAQGEPGPYEGSNFDDI